MLIKCLLFVAMCDLVQDVETNSKLLFPGYHSFLRKDFQILLAVKEGAIV